jgi:hypothetical protein
VLVGGYLLQAPAALHLVDVVQGVAQSPGRDSGVAGGGEVPCLAAGLGDHRDVAVGVVGDAGGGAAGESLPGLVALEEHR